MDYNFLSTIDSSGRFVIPKKLLKELGWADIAKVYVTIKDGKVIITRAEDFIKLCGNCNREINADFVYCPYCGVKISER